MILSVTDYEVDDQHDPRCLFSTWTDALDILARDRLRLTWTFVQRDEAPKTCADCCTPIVASEYCYQSNDPAEMWYCLECIYRLLQLHMDETPPEYMWCTPEHWLSRLEK